MPNFKCISLHPPFEPHLLHRGRLPLAPCKRISPSPPSDSVLPPPSPQWGHERAPVTAEATKSHTLLPAPGCSLTGTKALGDRSCGQFGTAQSWQVGLQPGWELLYPTHQPTTFVTFLHLDTHLPFHELSHWRTGIHQLHIKALTWLPLATGCYFLTQTDLLPQGKEHPSPSQSKLCIEISSLLWGY